MTVIYHKRSLSLFTLGNEWPFCLHGQGQTSLCRRWCGLGAIHHASLSVALPWRTPPGKYYCTSLSLSLSPAPSPQCPVPLINTDSDLTLEFESSHLAVLLGRVSQEMYISIMDDPCRVCRHSVLYGTAAFKNFFPLKISISLQVRGQRSREIT